MGIATLALLGALSGPANAESLVDLEDLAESLSGLEGFVQRQIEDQIAILPLTEEELLQCATSCSQPLSRAWSVHCLGYHPGLPSRAALVTALKDDATVVRKEAIEGLAKIGDRSSLNPLMKATAKETEPALQVLAQQASQQLVARNREAVAQDFSLINSTDAMERKAAIERAATTENWRAVPVLLEAVKDHHPAVREAAVLALGKLGDDRVLPVLHQLLQEETGRLRHAAIGSIALLANTQSLQSLQPLASADDVDTRRYVARALGWIPSSENLRTLQTLAADKEESVRTEVLLSISRQEDPNAAPILLEFLVDEAVFLRSEAARLLGTTQIEVAGEALIKALNDQDALVRINAASSIARLGEVRAIDALEKRIKKAENPEEAAYYRTALEQLGVNPEPASE